MYITTLIPSVQEEWGGGGGHNIFIPHIVLGGGGGGEVLRKEDGVSQGGCLNILILCGQKDLGWGGGGVHHSNT